MPMIRVLKPFVFTHPAKHGLRTSSETVFKPPVVPFDMEVSDEVFNHPWIRAGADGGIETPAQMKIRITKEVEVSEANLAAAKAATDAANAAFARTLAAEPGAKASASEIEAELQVPVSQLKKTALGLRVPRKDEDNINRPTNELRAMK